MRNQRVAHNNKMSFVKNEGADESQQATGNNGEFWPSKARADLTLDQTHWIKRTIPLLFSRPLIQAAKSLQVKTWPSAFIAYSRKCVSDNVC
jgi:hypothetical protein